MFIQYGYIISRNIKTITGGGPMILASKNMIETYTQKGYWGDTTLNQIFKGFVKKDPQKACFVDPLNKEELVGMQPERISYEDADRMMDALATAFLELGIRKDDVVIIQLPNIVELSLSYLALWRIGAVSSPVPVQWRAHELNYVIKLTGARALITLEEFHGFKHREAAEEIQKAHASLEHVLSIPRFKEMCQGSVDEDRLEADPPTANDITTVCWTSGTEAEPKACPLSHNNWIFQGGIISEAMQLPEGCVLLNPAPIVNMTGVGVGYILIILNGGTFVMHHPFDPFVFLRQLTEENVQYSGAVPALLVGMLKHPDVDKFDFSSIHAFATGSAQPPVWTLEEFKKRWNIEIINIWGQNEGTVLISGPVDVPDLVKRASFFPDWGNAGTTWPVKRSAALETKIVNIETGKPTDEPGKVGEYIYRGPNVMPCYFKQPEYTRSAFDEEGYFHTGDLFRIEADNHISFFDRKKDIIIRGGQNISAAEVENIVKSHPLVLDAAAVDMPDEKLLEKVCIYVVPAPDAKVTLEAITTFMREEGVATYKLPERLEIIDAIPRNPVGKVIKSTLREDIRKKLSGE